MESPSSYKHDDRSLHSTNAPRPSMCCSHLYFRNIMQGCACAPVSIVQESGHVIETFIYLMGA
jgi:hypothetical protein